MGTSDYGLLRATASNTGSSTMGPSLGSGLSNVMCLSCHRAHASGWDSIMRWNVRGEYIVYNGKYPATDSGAAPDHAQGRSSVEVQKAYYGRAVSRFSVYQRGLCNKCHAKD